MAEARRRRFATVDPDATRRGLREGPAAAASRAAAVRRHARGAGFDPIAHDFGDDPFLPNDALGLMGGPLGVLELLGAAVGGPPRPQPAPSSQDNGMDWQVAALARWTGEPFAIGLFAGLIMTPGGMQHERPTFEVLDTAHGAAGNGVLALGIVQGSGVLVGLAIDRVLGLLKWWWKFICRPLSFLQAVVLAWCFGVPKFDAAKRYALWSAVASLVVCPDAPKSLRLFATAYESYSLVGPYFEAPASLLTFWLSSFLGLVLLAAVVVNTIAPALWAHRLNPWSVERFLSSLPSYVRTVTQVLVMVTLVVLIVTPSNNSLVCLGAAFAPSWVLSRLSPALGRLAHLAFRLSEIIGKTSLLQRAGVAVWNHPMYQGTNTWESAAGRYDRQAMWRRYRRTVRLEGNKEAFRRRRREFDMLIEQGLMEEIPSEVCDVVLGYLGFPAGAQAPGADRDERDYRYFKRRRSRAPPLMFEPGEGMGVMLFLMLGLAWFRGGLPMAAH